MQGPKVRLTDTSAVKRRLSITIVYRFWYRLTMSFPKAATDIGAVMEMEELSFFSSKKLELPWNSE